MKKTETGREVCQSATPANIIINASFNFGCCDCGNIAVGTGDTSTAVDGGDWQRHYIELSRRYAELVQQYIELLEQNKTSK